MSVHAAKGLEWDLVCVVGLVNGSFPIQGRDAKGWLVAGKLPFALRGDRAKLPAFRFQLSTTQVELKESFESFQSQMRLRSSYEERRLAYVAITRAKHKLLLTASFYKQGAKKPRELSSFFTELLEAGALELLGPIPLVPEQNPLDQVMEVKTWPTDPLGAGRAQIEEAADRVQNAKTSSVFDSVEIGLLMEERERAGFLQAVSFPERLSASMVVALLKDPEDFAKRLARPLPNPYSKAASIGTKFHAELENAFGSGEELDDKDWNEQEANLALNFKNSRFKDMLPFLIEQEIQFRLAGVIIVCKIDAVFQIDGGYLVVDWKSGSTPKSQSDLDSRSIQLAIYRIALAKHLGIGVEKVRAAFFFAGDGQEVVPLKLVGELELANQIELARKAHRS
jgi:DNA helicase-2/ATP-dependent DNA helicase PcrA